MIWTEQAITAELDAMLVDARRMNRVWGWPLDRHVNHKMSLRYTWPDTAVPESKRDKRLAYMKEAMRKHRKAKQAAA